MSESLCSVVGRWAAELEWAEVPEEVRSSVMRGVLHSIAGGVGGYIIPETNIAVDVVRRENEVGSHVIYARGMKAPISSAIFVNSVMFCALEQQENHVESSTHPLEVVVPTALALAEKGQVTGRQFLEAVLAGVEVVSAFGVAGGECVPGFWKTTSGTCLGAAVHGTIGSAVAAARLLGLGADGITLAVRHAANLAAGLKECNLNGTTEYHYALANASRNGYLAAQLAASGAEATVRTLDGPAGYWHRFFEATVEQIADFDFVGRVGSRLGHSWGIPQYLYKTYPVHFFNLPFVDAAKSLRERHGIDPGEIDAIRVTINSWCDRCKGDDLGPYTGPEAPRAATAFGVASMLARGRFGLDESLAYDAEDIATLVRKSTILRFDDPARASDWRSTRVEVDAGGSTYVYDSEVDGTPDYRLPMERIRSVARDVLSRVEGLADVDAVIAEIEALPEAKSLVPLISMLA